MNNDQTKPDGSLGEYFTSVRHELHNILAVAQEGTSQILEGIGGRDCNKCNKILTPVLKSIKELNVVIDQMLSTSKFESMLAKYKDNTKIDKDDIEMFKKELIGVISHVVRTPLTVIKEGLALTIEEIPGSLNPKQKEILTTAKENTDRLVNYIERILNSSWDDTVKTIGKEVYYKSIIRNDKNV
jgi:signal transduction histidine kinase